MAAAWIGFGSGIVAALTAIFVAFRQAHTDQELERLKTDFAAELHRREALFDRSLVAEDVLSRYREPLAVAAFDLQSRLYNILRLDFFGKFGGTHGRNETALRTTLFRVAQYFGWTEILRRDIQFLSFPEAEETRRVAGLQSQIAKAFLTDELGEPMMIWADEQRALGELMIVAQQDKLQSMGYAMFDPQCETTFKPWLDRMRAELSLGGGEERLRRVQHLLCELVETLDVKRIRYPEQLERA